MTQDVFPLTVTASTVVTEVAEGTTARFLLLEFEGQDETCRVLVTKAGAMDVNSRLTETLLAWDDLPWGEQHGAS